MRDSAIFRCCGFSRHAIWTYITIIMLKLNCFWWTLSLHFGFRARDEWGDVALGFDQETGKEVLVWKAERGSKTRHGERHRRSFYPTAQASNSRRCPVSLYKTFASNRPDSSKFPESPFFLAVNNKRKPDSHVWYTKGPLGKNTIGQFLPKAAKAAGLSGKISNHSVRKTCISRLMDADVPSNFVAQLSGHKNLSLDAYKTASVTHQRQMSRFLSCSASDRPTSSSTSSLTETGETLSPNTSDAMSKATGLFSGARIDAAHLTSTLIAMMIPRTPRSKPKKDNFHSLMIQILTRACISRSYFIKLFT